MISNRERGWLCKSVKKGKAGSLERQNARAGGYGDNVAENKGKCLVYMLECSLGDWQQVSESVD